VLLRERNMHSRCQRTQYTWTIKCIVTPIEETSRLDLFIGLPNYSQQAFLTVSAITENRMSAVQIVSIHKLASF